MHLHFGLIKSDENWESKNLTKRQKDFFEVAISGINKINLEIEIFPKMTDME